MNKIILASNSKVRKKILDENEIECKVFPSNIDEDFITGVKYVGQLGPSGYAIAAKGYIFDMFQQGIPITWSPIDHGTGSEKEDNCIYSLVNRSLIEKRIDYNVLAQSAI